MKKLRHYYATLGLLATGATAIAEPNFIQEGLILDLNPATAIVDGGNSSWTSSAGTLAKFIVPDGSSAPSINLAGLKNQPTMRFDSEKKTRWQLMPNQAGFLNPATDGMTFFIVCRPDHFDKWQALVRKGNFRAAVQPGFSIAAIPGSGGRFVSRAATTDEKSAGVQSAVENPSSDFFAYTTVFTGTKIAGYLNGKSGEGFPNENYEGSIQCDDSLFVGIDLDGEIARILAYDRALSLEEINEVNAYLRDLYGLEFPDVFSVR